MLGSIALLSLTAVGFLIYKAAQVIYLAYFSPLRTVPGPWHARLTGIVGVLKVLSKQQVDYPHQLHKKYGPYIRTGPNEVMVADVAGYKAIHRIGGHFLKTDFYHFFGPTEQGSPPYGLFQMTDAHDHAARRKLLGRGFTQSSLRSEWEDSVREKVTAAVDGIRGDAKKGGGEADVRKWWQMMASDVISELMFGESFDAMKAGKQDSFFEDVKKLTDAAALALFLPWVYSTLKHLPVIGNARAFTAHRDLLEKGTVAVSNSRANGSSLNLFAKVQAEGDDARLSDRQISVEAASFMIAGSDTTSNTLTYLIWAVLRHPSVQKALEEELATVEQPFTDQILSTLPVLHAVIQETLRLYNAAPGPLPRIVPPGGIEMGGHFLPEGTQVATQSWTMHRDPEIFPDPDRFDYTRWMPSGPATLSSDANAAFTPFGGGSRNCIGKNLAMMELRYGAALFFQKCKGARLAPSTTDASMEMEILVLVEPVGKVCKVVIDDY